jgi:hypothetical protein
MNLKNYKDYACFDYVSVKSSTHKLGDVVIKETEDGSEIGVIIQIHEETEFRTDMFGNASTSEVRMATKEEIKKFRPNIKSEGNFGVAAAWNEVEEAHTDFVEMSSKELIENRIVIERRLARALEILGKYVSEKDVKKLNS